MSQQIHHIAVESFIRTKGSGKIDLEESIERLKTLCEVWNKDTSQNVLVDVRDRTFDLTPSDVRKFVEATCSTGLGEKNKVAMLYRYRGDFDHARFMEFLAVGKGMNIKMFEDYEEAVHWLATTMVLHTEVK